MNNDNGSKKRFDNKRLRQLAIYGSVAGIILLAIAGLTYLEVANQRIYVEKSEISAPKIGLSAKAPGELKEIYVKEGDRVDEGYPVARVDGQIVTAATDGLIISVANDIGKVFNPGEAVVSMINPAELRVVAHLEEDKGLNEIKVGQRVDFRADAFGSKDFYGIVDEISETSRESGAVFNISDKREKRQFDIKIRYNPDEYPELKNGMSAKVWIYKQ